MIQEQFTPTMEHLVLVGELSLPTKFALRLLAKSMSFRDMIDYLIEDDKHPDEEKCIMLAEVAHFILQDDLSIAIPSSIPLIYSDN